MGEFSAFVIGWNLILEYVIGTASVARGYSGYLDSLVNNTMQKAFRTALPINIDYISPYPDLPPPTYTESQWGPADVRREEDDEFTGGDFQFVPRYVTYTSAQ